VNLASVYRSTAFRLAGTFAVFFLLFLLVLFAVTYWLLLAELDQRLKDRLENTINTFIALEQNKGFAVLQESVRAHIAAADEAESIFLLLDKKKNLVISNIEPVAPFAGLRTIDSNHFRFTNEESSDDDQIVAQFVELSEGYLLVGHSTNNIVEIENIILSSFIWGMSGSMLLALIFAIWVGWRAQQRIHAIGNTLSAVAEGQIGRRIVLSGSGDDLDQVSERMNATLDRLQSLMESMRQISADIAHDLKTPIGRLRQKLDTALRSRKGEAELRRAITAAGSELDDVVETFDALLRIAQIEAGARRARFHSVDLRAVLVNIVEIYASVAEDAGMKLDGEFGLEGPALIFGDTELLTQMIANIVENAIRHCPAGSSISIVLSKKQVSAIVTIADNGRGIPEAERSKVFRRLYRLDQSRSTPGSGLGLPLVSAIADLHGAKIVLKDNSPGLIVELTFNRQNNS